MIMLITKDQLARAIAEKSGYFLKDIKTVLSVMDDVVFECFSEVTDEEEVMIQMATGIKCGCYVVPERQRKNPKTQEDIVCAPTVKPKTVFSKDFRASIQQQYEKKKAK
jgi:nucleoid DNA-binding protein